MIRMKYWKYEVSSTDLEIRKFRFSFREFPLVTLTDGVVMKQIPQVVEDSEFGR